MQLTLSSSFTPLNEIPKAIEHITFISCPRRRVKETDVLVSEYEWEVVGSEDDGEDVKIGVDNKEDRVLFETEEPTVAGVQELVKSSEE